MKLTNHPIGMPYDDFHWKDIQIPWVVNHHIRMGEIDPSIRRKPLSELKYSMKHYKPDDIRSIHRFLGAVEDSVESGKMRETLEMGITGKLKVLLLEDDHKLVFDTLTTVVKCVNEDRNGAFGDDLISGDGLDILLDLMDMKLSSGTDPVVGDHYIRMIRGNALYVFGYIIGDSRKTVMYPHVVDILMGKLNEDDGIERSNALFCFRMAVERGPQDLDYDEIGRKVMDLTKDRVEAVREEASMLLEVLRKKDLIGDII